MKSDTARAVLEVNLKNLKSNCETLKNLIPKDCFFCPMVKDRAYGHGLVPVVKSLLETGIKQVGVIDIQEAQELRSAIKGDYDILIFGTVLNNKDLLWAVENNIVLVVNSLKDLENLKSIGKPARIHLKFDTGFSRLGFCLSDLDFVKDFLNKNSYLKVEGLCTQLLAGEDLANKNNDSYKQAKHLQTLSKNFPSCHLHAFNSAALFSCCKNQLEEFSNIGVRAGISLYGIEPNCYIASKSKKEISLKKVSSLKSQVVSFHHIKKGAKVSYGGHFQAQKDSVIATVSLGYGDGLPRAFGSKREVLFRGKKVPIAGTVCMDFFMIDVTNAVESKPVTLGEEVVIFGRQGDQELSVEQQSEKVGTISYELFVRLGEKVKRVYT